MQEELRLRRLIAFDAIRPNRHRSESSNITLPATAVDVDEAIASWESNVTVYTFNIIAQH